FLVILVVAGQSLSGARAARALLVGFVFSIVTLLIDLVAWWQRISVPALQTAIPLIVAVLILVLGFLAARQFQNYSLRSKLVVSFVFITIASIVAIGYVTNRVASAQFDQEIGENFSELASRMAREVSDSIHASKLAMDGLV